MSDSKVALFRFTEVGLDVRSTGSLKSYANLNGSTWKDEDNLSKDEGLFMDIIDIIENPCKIQWLAVLSRKAGWTCQFRSRNIPDMLPVCMLDPISATDALRGTYL